MASLTARIEALEARLRPPAALPRVFVALPGVEDEVEQAFEAACAMQKPGEAPHVLLTFTDAAEGRPATAGKLRSSPLERALSDYGSLRNQRLIANSA